MNREETGKRTLTFYPEALGQPQEWRVSYAGLEYAGEVIVSETWNHTWGQRLPLDTYFRLIFLTTPRRIRVSNITDPRIAAVSPRTPPPSMKQSLQRELKAIRETKGLYETERSADILSLRYSIEEREKAIQRELVRSDARSYSLGRIYTQTGTDLAPSDIFVGNGPEAWADRLALVLLSRTYPDPPFDHSQFPHTLIAEDVTALYRGLFQGDAQARDVVAAFAPSLGLAKRDTPLVFDPEDSLVMDIIRKELESRNGEMPAEEMLSILRATYGLVAPLDTLYLLAFIRHMRAQIDLRPNHELLSLAGKPPSTDALTRDLITDVQFTADIAQGFQTLYLKARPNWNSVLPYANLMVAGLQPTNIPAHVEAQERQLLDALSSLAGRASETKGRLESLATSLNRSPGPHLEVLAQLERACSVPSYLDFYLPAQDTFVSPSALGQAFHALESLEQLADFAPEIARVRDYLREITFGPGHEALAVDRAGLLGQIEPENLISNPSLWLSLRTQFGRFRSEYLKAYRNHHAYYHQATASLSNRLQRMQPQVNALQWFHVMPELGEQVGSEVPQQFEALSLSFRTCLVADEELNLEEIPTCRGCSLRLVETIPHREVEQLLGELDRATSHYNQRLASKAVRDLLAHPTKEQLDKFIHLVQVSDLSTLGNVMDAEVIEFLRQYLRSA